MAEYGRIFHPKKEVPPNPRHTAEAAKLEAVHALQGKLTKAEVNYRPAESRLRAHCAECKFYENPQQSESPCLRVAGQVEGSAVCDLFETGVAPESSDSLRSQGQ